MHKSYKHITVFEHEALFTHKGNHKLTNEQLTALQNFYKEEQFPYYSLVHKGIRFCEYVGVLQVGNTVIEILPKADKQGEQEWRNMLVGMLKAVGWFNLDAPTSSNLKLKSNTLLHLYFQIFVQHTEELLHKGLIKKYHKHEANTTALKGNLLFAKQLQHNLTHQERFYVKHTVYDKENLLNKVLYKTIKLLQVINTDSVLQSRINALLLNFPELQDVQVSDAFFEKIVYNRKTEPYKKAVEIAKLILLNYHPDISKGTNNVLALMFDMNLLWEQFVYKSLKRDTTADWEIKSQTKKYFWKSESGNSKKIIPDIVIKKSNGVLVVLDTKWKNIGDLNPSDDDLKQMYVYSKFHKEAKTALVYPNNTSNSLIKKGTFYLEETESTLSTKECLIVKLGITNNIRNWQNKIANYIKQNIA